MDSPDVVIRQKAKDILMKESLFKAKLAQRDYDGIGDVLMHINDAVTDLKTFSLEHPSQEALVVFINATSFVFDAYLSQGFLSLALPYSVETASHAMELVEKAAPIGTKEQTWTAHFKLAVLVQIVCAYYVATENEHNASLLLEDQPIDYFSLICRMLQAAYSELRDTQPDSPMVAKGRTWVERVKAHFPPEEGDDKLCSPIIIKTICSSLLSLLLNMDLHD